jgi:hypothetical protein
LTSADDPNPIWPQCQGFYFFPEIVPSPTFTGTFNPNLEPEIVISKVDTVGAPLDAANGVYQCVVDEPVTIAFDSINVNADPAVEQYSYALKTGGLVSEQIYRVCVQVELPDGTKPLGYRDIKPEDKNEDNRGTDQSPVYEFKRGSNVNIKFRIEVGALCEELGFADCTFAVLGNDETAICRDATCGFQAGPNALPAGEELLVLVARVPCPATPETFLGLETDIPLVPTCLEVTAPGLEGPLVFDGPVISAMCLDVQAALAAGIKEDQIDMLQGVHRKEVNNEFVLEVLPNVPFAGLDCSDFDQHASVSSNPLVNFAMNGLRKVTRVVAPWLNPPPLKARDSGFGSEEESPIMWGLPVQMERGQIVNGQFVAWEDPVQGSAGGPSLHPAVRVVDGGDPSCTTHGDGCFTQNTAEGATVWFDVGGGGTLDYRGISTVIDPFSAKTKVVTDSAGIATVNWTLSENNPNTVRGVSIGTGCVEFDDDGDSTDDCAIDPIFAVGGSGGAWAAGAADDLYAPGPAGLATDGSGTFGDNRLVTPINDRAALDLGTGVMRFEANSCPVGPTVDGSLAGEGGIYKSLDTFAAKIGRDDVGVTVFFANDCDNFYLAVEVTGTEADNNRPLRLVFDNTLDGPSTEDDVLFVDKVKVGTGPSAVNHWMFADNYLSSGCLSSGQSSCAEPDPTAEGAGSFNGSDQGPATGGNTGVYEISHPLATGDADHDFQLALGDQVGFFIVLEGGNAARANIEWPDFRAYCVVTVNGAGGVANTASCQLVE